MGRAGDRRARVTRASMVATALAVLAASLLLAPLGARAQFVPVTPGDTVATEMAAGRVVAIAPTGEVREVAGGLESPRGVAVLPDGSILVAETGQNRIVGIGGRFGTGPPTPVASVPYPEGITVSPDGTVYVTLLLVGEMGRIDLDTGAYTPVATGLRGPGDVAARGIAMFVTESAEGGRVVTQVGGNGEKVEFATGFEQPIGLAFGPPNSLFVADLQLDQVLRLDETGGVTPFATVDAPVHVATEPWIIQEGQPYTVVVASAEGVVRFDETGARVGEPIAVTGAAGIATVPGTGPGGTPGPSVPPTTAPPPPTDVTPTTATTPETAPATTRPPRTTTTISEEEGAPSSTSGGILLASLVLIALIVVGGIVFAVVQRPKRSEKSGFEDRPLDVNTVALAFGACAAEEVELAEAEGALTSLEAQGEAAEKRLVAANERVAEAREALQAARRAARPDGSPRPAPAEPARSSGLRLEDLGLTSAAGKSALQAFLRHEIEADELEEMWRALGEERAIEVVRAARPASPEGAEPAGSADPTGTDTGGDAAVEDDEDDETRCERELAEAELDVEHARAEIDRLLEREAAARERIATARAALDACQERHRAELEAEAAAAEAAAIAAAAAARPDSPPPPPASRPDPVAEPAGPVTDAPDDQSGAPADAFADDVADPDPADPDPADPAPADPAPADPPTGAAPLPLTADEVAVLRRPAPADDPAPAADATRPADSSPGPTGAGEPPARRGVRREGIGRGLFEDDDAPAPAAGSMFPTPEAATAEPDPASEGDPAPPPAPPTERLHVEPTPVVVAEPDPEAERDPEPEPDPVPWREPDPAPGPRPEATTEPPPDAPTLPVADDEGPPAGPDATAPRPARPVVEADQAALSDLLFRPPAEDTSEAAELSSARIDDLQFAWPAEGFPTLRGPDDGATELPTEPPVENPAAAGDQPADGDDGPRPDLDFL